MLTTARRKLEALKNHHGFRRYAVHTSWMIGEKIVRMFVGLFVGIWVARYLGPEQFGLLSYAQSLVFLFVAVAKLGLDGILVRELVKNESRRDELLGTAFGLKLIGALLILPFLWLAVQLTSNDNHTNLLVFIIASATIFQSFNVIDFYYQSKVQSKYIAWANSIALGFSSIVKIALILSQANLTAFAIIVAFDALILAAGLVFFYKVSSGEKLFNWSFRLATAKQLLKDSWPLILSGLVISVYMKIDQVMIKEMLGPDAVGQYAAAVRLSEAWYFIPVVVANSVFPAIVNARKVNQEIYLKRLKRLYILMAWTAIGIALPMTLLGDWMIELLYGQAYQEAAQVLMVHIWASIFVFLGVASGKWLLSENLQLYSMLNTSVGAITNVVMNFFLIYYYGIIGSAIATLISYGLAAYLMLFVWRATRKNFYLVSSSINPASLLMIKSVVRKLLPKKIMEIIFWINIKYFDGYARKAYSQEGEDLILMRVFEGKSDGFYVDVGAHHPRRYSNTYMFYKKGWSGINIDARPGSMSEFSKQRPRDINIEVPISQTPENIRYYMFNEPALNGFSKEISEMRSQIGSYRIETVLEMKTVRLDDILAEHLPSGRSIDFLTIDVEGLDFEVIKSIDLKKYKPEYILIEALGSDLATMSRSEISRYLDKYSYSLYAKAVNTVFFKKMEIT